MEELTAGQRLALKRLMRELKRNHRKAWKADQAQKRKALAYWFGRKEKH